MGEQHVVVRHAVHQEQRGVDVRHARQHAAGGVAGGVGGGRSQIALGVVGVVEGPVRYRCHRGAGRERMALRQAHQHHVAAVGVAEDADAPGVHPIQGA